MATRASPYTVALTSPGCRARNENHDRVLTLDPDPMISQPIGDSRVAAVRATLAGWLPAHAGTWLPERVGVWSRKFQIAPPTVLVRGQRRRWGSCNRAGDSTT